uniref:4-hydroxybenzoyl-CoA reductase subunit alpha n=1 Tax=Anthurium amnicola TaxID=1678845 RepID=A0A1D1Y6I0_9ARAE
MCAADACTWRVHASKLPQVSTFRIRTLTPEHTCVRSENAGHRQATAKWIANCIREKLRVNRNYKPREILNDIHQEYGVLITYKRAFLGREKALEELRAEPVSDMAEMNYESLVENNHTEVQACGEIHDPPQKKRVCKPHHLKELRVLHCTRCNQVGHNRRTCVVPEPIQDEVG